MDHSNGDLAVFESGAIMIYLAERYGDGSLLPKEGNTRYEVIQWLMFQMGGLGPMMGQANHFIQYAPETVPYGQKRYYNESKRLLGVLESRLKDHEYLAGDQFTLADIANFCWVLYAYHAAIDVDEFPSVKVRPVEIVAFLVICPCAGMDETYLCKRGDAERDECSRGCFQEGNDCCLSV